MKHVKLINTISASTFGVLLIHANSDFMRQWLWNDTIVVKSLLCSDIRCGLFLLCSLLVVSLILLERIWLKKYWLING